MTMMSAIGTEREVAGRGHTPGVTNTDGPGAGCDVFHPHLLSPVSQEVADPLTGGGGQRELDFRDDAVEHRAESTNKILVYVLGELRHCRM